MRADDVSLTEMPEHQSSIMNTIPVTVRGQSILDETPFSLIELDAFGTTLFARITNDASRKLNLRVGAECHAQIKAAAITAYS